MSWNGIGPVTVVTPGTKVPLSANDLRCDGIMLQALSNGTHTNTGRVYLFDKAGIRIATLATPASGSIPVVSATIPVAPGGLNVKDYTIDADNATDGADVSYMRP